MKDVFDHLERVRLATLPTPLEAGPTLDGERGCGSNAMI